MNLFKYLPFLFLIGCSDSVCAIMAEKRCQWQKDCFDPALDLSTCITKAETSCNEIIQLPGMAKPDVENCTANSCNEFTCDFQQGTLQNDELCQVALQCASETCANGKCSQGASQGESCDNLPCKFGLICDRIQNQWICV